MYTTPVPATQYKDRLYKDKHGDMYFTLVNCPCAKTSASLERDHNGTPLHQRCARKHPPSHESA